MTASNGEWHGGSCLVRRQGHDLGNPSNHRSVSSAHQLSLEPLLLPCPVGGTLGRAATVGGSLMLFHILNKKANFEHFYTGSNINDERGTQE